MKLSKLVLNFLCSFMPQEQKPNDREKFEDSHKNAARMVGVFLDILQRCRCRVLYESY